MKKHIIVLAFLALALPLFAQESNDGQQPASVAPTGDVKPESPQATDEPKVDRGGQFKARQLKLMEKSLKEIGVTEQQQVRIFALQEEHMEKMKANWKRLNRARNELSRLQDECAPIEDIDAAIQEVADAQAEQLKIFAHNRREMEQILGKEKNDKFMENARDQFRRSGRRPGPDMPPRPGQDDGPNRPRSPDASGRGVPPPPSS